MSSASPIEAGFRFKGQAYGVSGRITSPVAEVIDVQAKAVLPESGGYGTSHVTNFHSNKYIRFDHAHAVVDGAHMTDADGESHGASIRSTIEGLNIMDMITADRIVARLSYRHSAGSGQEPAMHLVGSRYENLRIAGVPVNVRLAVDLFDEHETHAKMQKAYIDTKSAVYHHVHHRPKLVHEKIKPHLLKAPTKGLPERLSLVKELEVESPAFHHSGNLVYVPGFATIRLAEVELHAGSRGVTMLSITFNSPPQGGVDAGGAHGG